MRGGFGEAPAEGCDSRPPSPAPAGGAPTAPARPPLKPSGKGSAAGAGGVPARSSPLRSCRGAPRQPSLALVGSAEVRVRSRAGAARAGARARLRAGSRRGRVAARTPGRAEPPRPHPIVEAISAVSALASAVSAPRWGKGRELGKARGRAAPSGTGGGAAHLVPLALCSARAAAPPAGGERRPRLAPPCSARERGSPGRQAGGGGWHRLRGDGTRWPGARDGDARPSWPRRAGGRRRRVPPGES